MLDIDKFDLKGLQMLQLGYENVLADHKSELNKIEDTGTVNKMLIEGLESKISFFESEVKRIKERITALSKQSLRFSVEYFFQTFGLTRKAVQFHFVTTSDAYETYGQYVTGGLVYTKEEILDQLQRPKGQYTDGYIKVDDKISDLSAEQRDLLRTKGFLASDIDSISYV